MKYIRWIAALLNLALIPILLFGLLRFPRQANIGTPVKNVGILDKLDQNLRTQADLARRGIEEVEPVYWLSDEDLLAPVPNSDCYGMADEPAALGWLLEDAQKLLSGQNTLFSTDTVIQDGSSVRYYLDSTIFSITWKEQIESAVYTFCEVKIAHPSQFRRFLADGHYGAATRYTANEMAKSVNAVAASAGDYYAYRPSGVVVYNGKVHRARGELLDTCFIDDKGDLLLVGAGEFTDLETTKAYVEENNVRFSLSFGPIMILDGEQCVPESYSFGEITGHFSRAALCQLGELHYLVVTLNPEGKNDRMLPVEKFADRLVEKGVPKAYALDGGQTATIVMDGQVINTVSFGAERKISDILYFATAVPNG